MVQTVLPGRNVEERCSQLYREMQTWYSSHSTSDQLNTLTETMLRKNASSAPKLKAKGAETRRRLVPFALQAAQSFLLRLTKPQYQATCDCLQQLALCCQLLGREPYAGRKFAGQYVAWRPSSTMASCGAQSPKCISSSMSFRARHAQPSPGVIVMKITAAQQRLLSEVSEGGIRRLLLLLDFDSAQTPCFPQVVQKSCAS